MTVVPNLLRVAPSRIWAFTGSMLPECTSYSIVWLFVCCHSDSECGPSGGGQSGCDPRGGVCKTGGKGRLPPGVSTKHNIVNFVPCLSSCFVSLAYSRSVRPYCLSQLWQRRFKSLPRVYSCGQDCAYWQAAVSPYPFPSTCIENDHQLV